MVSFWATHSHRNVEKITENFTYFSCTFFFSCGGGEVKYTFLCKKNVEKLVKAWKIKGQYFYVQAHICCFPITW